MRIVLAMMLCTLPLVAEIPKEHLQIFYQVSVECQNGRYGIQHLRPGMNIDPSQVEPFVKRIDKLLGELVEKKALKQEVIELKNPNEMKREDQGKMFKMVMDAVGNLGEEYGFYVAAEMVDMGLRREVMTVQKEDAFSFTLRMPEKELQALKKQLTDAGFMT